MTSDPGSGAIERLAGLVAEGRDIDWDHELLSNPEARRQIENLRVLARLAAGPTASPSAVDEPTTWGHLERLEPLGSGGFGSVYRAFDPVLQRHVALKLRRLAGNDQKPDAFAFIEEARRLARVRHPHVLGVHGADIHDGLPGLWCDLIEGGTLEDELASSPGPARAHTRALEVGAALASALEAVHAAGLAHGDVKASNVAVEPDGRVVLLDFGASSAYAGPSPARAAGSPLSAAPERLAGQPLQPSADVYGLGVVLYRILAAGAYPIPAASLEELQLRHSQGSAELAARKLRGPLRQLVASLLAVEPRDRPTAREVIDALSDIAVAPQRRRRRLAIAVALVGLGTAVIGLGVGLGTARLERDRAKQQAARAQEVQNLIVDLFRASDPAQSRGEETTARELLERAVQRIDEGLVAHPAVQAQLLGVVGEVYRTLGRYDHAVELLERAEDLARANATVEPLLVARVLHLLGEALTAAGRYDEGEAALREALSLQRDLAGARSLEVAETSDALAVNRHAVSQWDEAGALLEQALEIFTSELGPSSPAALGSLGNLATIAFERGDFVVAVERSQQVVDLRFAVHGENHPGVAAALTTLASAQRRAGRLAEARRSLERSLVIKRQVFDPGHPSIVTSLNNLGATLASLGDYAEAAEIFRQALELDRVALGDDHPTTARSRENLAGMLIHVGGVDEATALLDQAAPITRATADPVSWAAHLSVRSWLEERRGDASAAIRAADGAIAAIHDTLGAQHPRTTILRARRARLEPNPEARWVQLDQALRDQIAVLPADHLEVASTRIELGATLIELGSPDHAAEQLALAATALKLTVPADHWRLAEVAALVGAIHCDPIVLGSLPVSLRARPAAERLRRLALRCN